MAYCSYCCQNRKNKQEEQAQPLTMLIITSPKMVTPYTLFTIPMPINIIIVVAKISCKLFYGMLKISQTSYKLPILETDDVFKYLLQNNFIIRMQ